MFKVDEAFKALKEYLDNKVSISELGYAYLKKLHAFMLIDRYNSKHA